MTERIAGVAGSTDLDPSSVVTGEIVRELVARSEQEILDLLAELEAAESEAQRIEQEVRIHPALATMASTEARLFLPPRRPDRGRDPTVTGPPRTTVDARPCPERTVGGSGSGPSPVGHDPTSHGLSWMTRLSRSHWVWRTGVALVLVALALLKFG